MTETNEIMDLNNLKTKVEQWAQDRGLDGGDPYRQLAKLMEEAGEMAGGMARSDIDRVIDGVGDILVVLIILSMQMGIDVAYCLNVAYEEIKHRKGKMIDGVFVKEEDIEEDGDEQKREANKCCAHHLDGARDGLGCMGCGVGVLGHQL